MSREHIDSLAEWVETHGPLAPAAAVQVALAMLDGLEGVHAQGRSHGAVNPRNVGRRPDGTHELRVGTGARRLAAFDAPEVHKDAGAHSVQSDLYGVGVCLAWAIAGTPTLDRYTAEDLGSLREREPALWEVVERVTRYTVAERHPSAAALRDDLGGILADLGGAVAPPRTPSGGIRWGQLPARPVLLGLLFLGLALGALAVLAWG
jgi:hypothetical protein